MIAWKKNYFIVVDHIAKPSGFGVERAKFINLIAEAVKSGKLRSRIFNT